MSILDELALEVVQGSQPANVKAPTKDAYDELPESIKATITRKSWMWLSDREKADLVSQECEPDHFDC